MATRTHTNLLVWLQRSMAFFSTDKVYASRPARNAAVTVLSVRRLPLLHGCLILLDDVNAHAR
jgi:hypothetical protein